MGSTNSAELNIQYNEYNHIGKIAKQLMHDYKDNIQENDKAEVIIDIDIINLNRHDIEILEGIILASGHTYYED